MTRHRTVSRLPVLLALVGLTGCTYVAIDTKNPVFQQFSKYPMHNLSLVNREAMTDWFLQHDEAAEEISGICRDVKEPLEPSWYQSITVQSRICTAANRALKTKPHKN